MNRRNLTLQNSKLPRNVSKYDVCEQMERILNSNSLRNAGRLKDFLKYIVSAMLEDTIGPIKEYHIAVEVFGRKPSFDPRLDPIVRVEAGRLRMRMKQYAETEGQNDWLLIHVPKGGYMPIVEISGADWEQPLRTEPSSSVGTRVSANHIGVALLPFLSMGATPNTDFVCDSLTEELIDMLTDVDGFLVAPRVSVSQFKHQPDDARSIGRRLCVNFLLEGSVRHSEDLLQVKMRLIHTDTGFGRRLGNFQQRVEDLASAQREICESIISKLKLQLQPELGIVDTTVGLKENSPFTPIVG